MDGGGVASCRRDLVDRLHSIRWEMIAELGNEERVISNAYQVEHNVLSLKLVPLWGNTLGSLAQTVYCHQDYGILNKKVR